MCKKTTSCDFPCITSKISGKWFYKMITTVHHQIAFTGHVLRFMNNKKDTKMIVCKSILEEYTRQKTSSRHSKWDRSFTMRDCKLDISFTVTPPFEARSEMPLKMMSKWLSWHKWKYLEEILQKKVLDIFPTSYLRVTGSLIGFWTG
jgi:hypothetical protein